MITRPRGVRWMNPSCSRYGSYTSSIVSGSSPSDTASVDSPTGPPPNLWTIAREQFAVDTLESRFVDLEQLERLAGDVYRDRSCVAHLGDVADPAQDAVRDARRPARPSGDLVGRLVGDLDAEDPRRPAHDRRELVPLVVAEPERHAEAVAQRRRQQASARRCADEREARQVDRQGPGARALSDDDVETEVLERRVEDLLDRTVHPMDLVDEEDVLVVEPGQDGRHVALALECRPGDRADPDVELLADDRREGRLPQSGRPDEEHVVERLSSPLGRFEGDLELFLRPLLADEVVQPPRPQRLLDLLVTLLERRSQELAAHAALLRASRTRSSTGSATSTVASACSASTSE